jgi:CRISPR-associated protein Csb2
MTNIRLEFPAGRYHATPWGRHVNEGVAEWPPSPYRLLRALYDVWKRKCFGLPEEEVCSVLERLAESPPQFRFPAAVATHTRSYLSANKMDPADKNLVFDPFLVFDRAHACYLCWPDLCLPARDRETLQLLLKNLNYLGRSESWVQAELWDGVPEGAFESFPADITDNDHELEKIACAIPAAEYSGKRTWMEGLTYSSGNLLKERASAPPLLRQVRYATSKGAIAVDSPRRALWQAAPVHAVLIGLDATVLPLATATLEVAEQVRVRLMGAHKRRAGSLAVSSLFSGKTPEGGKRLDHGHVYILPLASSDPRRAGRIDRILIVSRHEAFDVDELDAVRGVRELWQSEGRPTVQCVVTWQGGLGAGGEFRPSPVVESATPFVPPRHWRKGRDPANFIEAEVRRECWNHGISAVPVHIENIERLPSMFHVSEYRRNRKDDPVRPGYALRLSFDKEVLAPFAIGYAAHFGLGQFQAVG